MPDMAKVDPFLSACDDVYEHLRGFSPADEDRRSEFQAEVRRLLEAKPINFNALGEMEYRLEPRDAGRHDWRRRDINRILTRYREDRPIADARRWARLAVILALLAFASSIVSAINDAPGSWENLVKLFHLL
jgi:hypothetical protein